MPYLKAEYSFFVLVSQLYKVCLAVTKKRLSFCLMKKQVPKSAFGLFEKPKSEYEYLLNESPGKGLSWQKDLKEPIIKMMSKYILVILGDDENKIISPIADCRRVTHNVEGLALLRDLKNLYPVPLSNKK